MRLSAAPLSSRILGRILGKRELIDLSSDVRVIAESEERPVSHPTLVIDGQYDLIKQAHEFSKGLEVELRISTEKVQQHGQTRAYQLHNMFLIDGIVCNYRDFQYLSYKHPHLRSAVVRREYDTAALCSSPAGNDFFAHFIFDDASTALVGEEFGPVVFGKTTSARTPQMYDYLQRYDIGFEDLDVAFFRKLWMFDDMSLNSHRVDRIQTLRGRLADHKSASAPGVYIARGTSGIQRSLKNEDAILDRLIAMGFEILEPEKQSLEEMLPALSRAKVAIGIEGSHLAHAVMALPPDSTLFCIQPPYRYNAVYRSFTNTAGLKWGFVVGSGDTQGFDVDMNDLLATLDLALNAV